MATPAPGTTRDVTRVQIDLPSERVAQLDALAAEAGTTRKDLFNNALALLQWAVKESRKGRVIASVDEANEQFVQLHLPFLTSFEPPSPPKR
jgi:hypothetical protein